MSTIATQPSPYLISTLTLVQDQQASLEKSFNDFLSSVDNSPQVSTAVSVFLTALPTTVVQGITSDPASFYQLLATATSLPTDLSKAINAIPTSAALYLQSAVSRGADIVASEMGIYESSVVNDPKWTSALNAVDSAVPSSVLSLIANDPSYALSFITATSLPSWTTAIPSNAVSYLNSIENDAASIVSANTAGPKPTAAVTSKPSSGFAQATSGTAKPSGGAANSTVAPFKGAASPMKAGGLGAGAVFAAIAMWFHV